MDISKGADELDVAIDRERDDFPFYCVSPWKLAALSLVTFNLYQLVWFYKNWGRIRDYTGHRLSPFWRTFFAPFFCYPLVIAVKSAAESAGLRPRLVGWLIVPSYFGLLLSERLPDPYWLLSLFSFVPLVPIAHRIRAINEATPGSAAPIGWGGWSYAILVVGSMLTGLVALFSLTPSLPSTRVLKRAEIPSSYTMELVEAGVLGADEKILFFYSSGVLSIMGDGNLLTDSRVVSYESLSKGLHIDSAPYSEVADYTVRYSEHPFEDTVLTVFTEDGDEFVLILSSEGGRDRDFVRSLSNRVSRARRPDRSTN